MGEEHTRDLPDEALEDIALIGMAGRFPGAADVEQFWRNLQGGVESITFFSDEELLEAGVDPGLLSEPDFVKARGVLEGVELFDAAFFGLSPKEAAITDPQHRVFLECSWEALEQAGYDAASWDGRVGVFAGVTMSTYLLSNLLKQESSTANKWQIGVLNEKDALSTRVSYKLNLKGPSLTVQTACSTSLVAVHLARQSLLNYECDMALAGGVTIRIPQKTGYLYQPEGAFSPDGHCRAFDVDAAGVVFGSGAGVVLCKRLEDALADGDSIFAVIKGSAVNNDGSLKVGFTAPSIDGQAEVIAKCLAIAEIDPAAVGYVEAHGTGTALGDPIEISALTRAYGAGTSNKGYCAIGSVKTNIGHLDSAAGVTGLIKTALALKHRRIPPSLHFKTPNPQIDFENSPFFVVNELREWESGETPRRAAVSAFGIGGTNAHVILEEAPAPPISEPSGPWQLLLLSARTAPALERVADKLVEHLQNQPEQDLGDVAYTLKVGRKRFDHRRMLVCRSREDALQAITSRDPERFVGNVGDQGDPALAFMFPGAGPEHVDMGRGLYELEPTFRDEVDRCAEHLRPQLGFDLRDVLYPTEEKAAEAAARLAEIEIAQPALFVTEYAAARLLLSWGVRPQAMIGYSTGEYLAAHIAGVMSLEDVLDLVTLRSRLMLDLPRGAVLAVALPEGELTPLLSSDLYLAAVNGPSQSVVSGTVEAVEQLQARFAVQGVETHRLAARQAYHSPMMAQIVPAYVAKLESIRLRAPEIPYVSNVTGTWIREEEATDPQFWIRHMCEAVRFADGLKTAVEDPDRILLEVGPGNTLSTLTRRHPARSSGQTVIASMRHRRDPQPDTAVLLTALGRLWLAGAGVDWSAFHAGERRRRVALPTYPFERRRHWIEAPKGAGAVQSVTEPLRKRPHIADWFHLPSWKRSLPPTTLEAAEPAATESCWLLFVDACGLGAGMAEYLEQGGRKVVQVLVGEDLHLSDDGGATIHPSRRDDYEALLQWLRGRELKPEVIVHLWNVTPTRELASDPEFFEQMQGRGFDSLCFLTRAWCAGDPTDPLKIGVVSNHLQRVTGEEVLCPAKATLLGLCGSVPGMSPLIDLSSIDVVVPEVDGAAMKEVAVEIASELAAPAPAPVVAYRGGDRWVPTVEAVRLDEQPSGRRWLRDQGVYLLTGGLGPVGFEIVKRMAGLAAVRLAFIEPAALPPRSEWDGLSAPDDGADESGADEAGADEAGADEAGADEAAADSGREDREAEELRDRLRKVRELEQLGAQVLVLGADLTDREQMREALRQVREGFGPIHGVLHLAARINPAMADPIAAPPEADPQTPQQLRSEVRRKTVGALVLGSLLRDQELDFFVAFSSLPAMPVLLDQPGHAGASALLDALAHERFRRSAGYTVTIDWGQNVGFRDFEEGWPAFVRVLRQSGMTEEVGMSSDEAFEVLSRILGSRLVPQIIASTQNTEALARLAAEAEVSGMETAPQPRPELKVDYVPPDSPLDRMVADVWQEVLGVSQVGVHDNFFDLGGDSLIALQVVTRLRKVLPVEVQIRMLFENPTLTGFGTAVKELLTEAVEEFSKEEAQQISRVSEMSASDREALTKLQSKLSSAKQALLAGWDRAEPARRAGEDRIPQRPDPGSAPLSFAQERLWFLYQLDPGSPTYNERALVRLDGNLDPAALERAFAEVVRRHALLRTGFTVRDDQPVQVIVPQVGMPLPVVDLRGCPQQAAGAQSERLIRREARRPFDLTRPPLLRSLLIRLDHDRYLLLLTMHHIVSDGWSSGILIRESGALYEAFRRGRPSPLAPLPVQYADFAHWQRRWLRGAVLDKRLAHWREQLAGSPPVLELLTDRPRPPIQRLRGRRFPVRLPASLAAGLKQRGREREATPFMMLLAAFQLLLWRYTAQRDFCVGTPVANRNRPELEGLIGFFVNPLVVRADLRGNPPFVPLRGNPPFVPLRGNPSVLAFLDQVRRTTLDAYAHQDLPFELLVEELSPERNLSHSPLFQVMIVFQNTPTEALELPDLTLNLLEFDDGTTKFDLVLNLTEQAQGLVGFLEYDVDLFDRATIARLAGHFRTLVEGVIADPERRVAELPLVSAGERHQLLGEWNATGRHHPRRASLQELFETQVKRRPEAVAAVFGRFGAPAARLSYGELNARANRLAHHLRRLGVGPETAVGLCVERSLELIVGTLGIIKAGGAYVPLDPSYPAERLAFMVADSGAAVVLSQGPPAEHLHELGVESIALDRELPTIATAPADDPVVLAEGGNLAYVIYTSGSTGKAKGVAVPQRAISRLVLNTDYLQVQPGDRVAQASNASFDAATFEIWGALLNGATLVGIERFAVLTPQAFGKQIRDRAITALFITTALFDQLAREAPSTFASLRHVLFGGEA
ncbi:MAG: AMP-binding protein, partial [bacterium]|nr:AMP-binding protein [bacterium]